MEKAFFSTALILDNGFHQGQQSSLRLLQYTRPAWIYNYLSDYEVMVEDRVRSQEVVRGIQEGTFPFWFTRLVADEIF